MLKKSDKKSEILFILDNLREEDRIELEVLYGKEWKNETLITLSDKKCYILYGKDSNNNLIPIAMGDFFEIFPSDDSIACVWLLTTKYIYANKHLFYKHFIDLFNKKCKKYNIMFNFIYKSNYQAKKWLQKLGFKFDNPYPKGIEVKEGFEFFYKITERKD